MFLQRRLCQLPYLQQFVNLPAVQVQMVDVATYHGIEGHPATFVVNPIAVELCLVNRTDNVADVPVV